MTDTRAITETDSPIRDTPSPEFGCGSDRLLCRIVNHQALMPTEAELQAELERDRALLETK